MSTTLTKIALKAKTDPKLQFTSLAHLLTREYFKECWSQMNKAAAKGIDGETMAQFAGNLDARIEDLAARLKSGSYKAPLIRRVDIPKGNGKTRTLGVTTVEDRLVQRAVAGILGTIFEQDFLDVSCYRLKQRKRTYSIYKFLVSLVYLCKSRGNWRSQVKDGGDYL